MFFLVDNPSAIPLLTDIPNFDKEIMRIKNMDSHDTSSLTRCSSNLDYANNKQPS